MINSIPWIKLQQRLTYLLMFTRRHFCNGNSVNLILNKSNFAKYFGHFLIQPIAGLIFSLSEIMHERDFGGKKFYQSQALSKSG